MTLTPEAAYRFHERLGILFEDRIPEPSVFDELLKEAVQWQREYHKDSEATVTIHPRARP